MGGTNVITVFGVQGSGKSYTVGALIEGGLIAVPELGPLPKPLATVVFHYSADATYRSEFATLATPTHDPAATEWLKSTGSFPAAVDEVVVLVPSRQVERRRAEYGDVRVEPLTLSPSELTLADWKLLMGIDGGRQMYAKELKLVFKDLGSDFTVDQLTERIERAELPRQQKGLAKARVRFVEEYLSNAGRVRDWLTPGRLLIIDVRDEYIDKEEALSIFMVLLSRFAETSSEGSQPFNKMVVFDEAHKYMTQSSLTEAIKEAVREMRHKGVTMVIASQDPQSIPTVVVELSTIIVAHRITSPTWLRTLRNASQAFESAGRGELAGLRSGEALIWSAGGSVLYRQPQRVKTRPRLTEHGGDTVRVDG
jgi:DNA helicase HerA-like ATPase